MRLVFLLATALLSPAFLLACTQDEERPSASASPSAPATATTSGKPLTSSPTGSPAPATPRPDFVSFRDFASEIDAAVDNGDSGFFIDRAKHVEITCSGDEQLGPCSDRPGGTVITGIPGAAWRSDAFWVFSPIEYTENLERYFGAALPGVVDDYGDGSLFLYALAWQDAEGKQVFRAITTSILDVYPSTGHPIGRTEREAHAFNFEFEAGRWVFTGEKAAVGLVASSDWLSGQCDYCYDYWERWEGAAH